MEKRRMKKICILIMVMVLFALNASALSFPQKTGVVLDTAGVLSNATVQDVKTLNDNLFDACYSNIYVVTRHFLGGMDSAQYADALFSSWNLGENDALLLLVIGEENSALSLGTQAKNALPSEIRAMLMGTYFRKEYQNRQYDEAVGKLLPQIALEFAQHQGVYFSTKGLFGHTVENAVPQETKNSYSLFGDFITVNEDYDEEKHEQKQNPVEKKTGISFTKFILLVIILNFLFGKKRARNKFNFRHPPRR